MPWSGRKKSLDLQLPIKWKATLVYTITFLVLALLIVLLGASYQLDEHRAKFYTLSVPSGMLD